MRMTPPGWHPAFARKHCKERFLDHLFFLETDHCRLCGRSAPRRSAVGSPHRFGMHLLLRVCPFCLQDITKISLDPALRHLPLPPLVAAGRGSRRGFHVKPLGVLGAMPYQGPLVAMIRAWKYDGAIELTDWFGMALVTVALGASGGALAPDWIVPVPTSPDRLSKRGYDQAYLLAAVLAREISAPVLPALIKENRHGGFTESQTSKSQSERMQALEGQIELARAGAEVAGKRVLLVDDVVTTGSTMAACASALYQAGAADVMGAAVAYVP
ncbi:ComF family protein [Alicyclobacillus sp. SP_1]|uniref:ComF family protein n=1 Tax=Alicyclobacillus sp. SP_1 TaxID=2942475 RepID=UPI0021571645|nr:phosphoribosyltransferase family protein [Alicyclobacillus sp. SP_1]